MFRAAFLLAALISVSSPVYSEQACPVPEEFCDVCGCKGGPGYRSLVTGECVGYARLYAVCGDPPSACCTYEGGQNTGANRECALDGLDIEALRDDALPPEQCNP